MIQRPASQVYGTPLRPHPCVAPGASYDRSTRSTFRPKMLLTARCRENKYPWRCTIFSCYTQAMALFIGLVLINSINLDQPHSASISHDQPRSALISLDQPRSAFTLLCEVQSSPDNIF